MKKNTMIWLVIAACLVLVGGTVFFFAMAANHWNFSLLSGEKMETRTFEITDEFRNISILTDTEDIGFCLSDDGKCKVVCVEKEKESHTAEVQDGTLTIRKTDSEKWFDHISLFSYEDSRITVHLPKAEYEALFIEEDTGDVSIPKEFVFGSMDLNLSTGDVECQASTHGLLRVKISTGDISLKNISAGELDLTGTTGQMSIHTVTCEGSMGIALSTGKAELTDVSCKSFSSTGSTGDVTLKNVTAAENMSIERSTGDVRFEKSDAGELTVVTDTGDVTGSLLTDKIFVTQSDTGNIDVPETVSGGKCKITTDTGDIRIEIVK